MGIILFFFIEMMGKYYNNFISRVWEWAGTKNHNVNNWIGLNWKQALLLEKGKRNDNQLNGWVKQENDCGR